MQSLISNERRQVEEVEAKAKKKRNEMLQEKVRVHEIGGTSNYIHHHRHRHRRRRLFHSTIVVVIVVSSFHYTFCPRDLKYIFFIFRVCGPVDFKIVMIFARAKNGDVCFFSVSVWSLSCWVPLRLHFFCARLS